MNAKQLAKLRDGDEVWMVDLPSCPITGHIVRVANVVRANNGSVVGVHVQGVTMSATTAKKKLRALGWSTPIPERAVALPRITSDGFRLALAADIVPGTRLLNQNTGAYMVEERIERASGDLVGAFLVDDNGREIFLLANVLTMAFFVRTRFAPLRLVSA